MNFEDLKDRIQTESRQILDKVQESSTYNRLMDRYENMSPSMQKITLIGGISLIALVVLSFPYSYYSTSQEYEDEFLAKRQVIRDLLKTVRESQSVPNITPAPSVDLLRGMVETQLTNAQLLPEQKLGVSSVETDSKLIPESLSSGALEVKLAKLNLKQVVDLGYQLQSINSSVKLKDVIIQANKSDGRYMDVTYKLVALAVPEMAPPAPPEESN